MRSSFCLVERARAEWERHAVSTIIIQKKESVGVPQLSWAELHFIDTNTWCCRLTLMDRKRNVQVIVGLDTKMDWTKKDEILSISRFWRRVRSKKRRLWDPRLKEWSIGGLFNQEEYGQNEMEHEWKWIGFKMRKLRRKGEKGGANK